MSARPHSVRRPPWLAALALLLAGSAQAAVIKFDEYAAQNANGVIPANRYARWGVTFDATDDGSTWDGTSNGDPGGWGVDGSAGTVFSGYNGSSYSNRVVFARTVRSFALDVTRTAGSSPGDTFTLEGWRNGAMVESRVVSLSQIDEWRTAALFSTVDEVRWSGAGAGFHPFGVDNVRWTNAHTSRILFDEYPAQNANGANTNDYSALGVTISSADDGSSWNGIELGDPGGWGVDGTEGSVFAGHNGASYQSRYAFTGDVANFAVDLSRTAGSSPGDTVTLEGWRDGALVESRTVALDAIDRWRTVTLLGSVDEVRVQGAGGGFHPFAMDNLRWTTTDAGVILFDEFAADNANGPMAADRYADRGVTFVATDDGSTWDGTARGDPGGWALDGTNGSVFAGFNGGSYGLGILFDGLIEEFMLDVARSAGSSEGDTVTLEGYLEGVLIDSITAELTAIDTWMPFALTGQIDEVRVFGAGTGFHPFGIDNLNWLWVARNEPPRVPEPGTPALLLGAMALAAGLRRARGRRHSA